MKQVQKNEFVTSLLQGAVGPDVEVDGFPVWEVVATSSIPLRGKEGTLFEDAVIQPSTLFQLAAYVNRDPLPLMVDHDMTGAPKGKFFYAEVMPNAFGPIELRGYKYVDPTEGTTIVKINNGTIDEVSIAFLAKEMLCNKCGYDFRAAMDRDDLVPLFTRTCENGHMIGKDGTHLELHGVDEAFELSLVSRGAAKNSKIVGQSDSKLGKQIERLAAHGLNLNDFIVTASAPKGNEDMDMKDLIVELAEQKARTSVAERDVERLNRELAEARGAQAEAESNATRIEAELREAQAVAQAAPTAEEREVAKKDAEDVKAAATFLTSQYVAVLTAAGEKDITPPESVEELIAGIEKHKAELSAILPTGGVAEGAGAIDDKTEQDFSMYRARPQVKR